MHPGRRKARFSEMQYSAKQIKSPSLDSFQDVYTQMTSMKGVSSLSVGDIFNPFSNRERSWTIFLSA